VTPGRSRRSKRCVPGSSTGVHLDPTRLDGVPRVTPEGGSEVPTMTAGLDLRTPLRQVAQTGIAFIPCALNDAFRQALLQEVGGGPFIALPEQMGPKAVHQQAEAFDVSGDLTAYHLLCALRDHLVELTRDHGSGIAGLDRWLPNHAAVQRYQPGTQGISPHLDGRRFRYLVAIFTVTGSAHFALCADRAGRVLSQWQAGAGSLILMRGPGLAGIADGRPLHTVGGPSERTRVSVTYRMETRSR
jgi:hypothetical protein